MKTWLVEKGVFDHPLQPLDSLGHQLAVLCDKLPWEAALLVDKIAVQPVRSCPTCG